MTGLLLPDTASPYTLW